MEKYTLNSGKDVLISDPYDPGKATLTPFQGRENEMKMVFASWIGGPDAPPLCPLMVGDPGVGKNRIVYELKKITGLSLYILQGHEDITAEDLACSVRFQEANRIEYVCSPLVTAMLKGGICFIDEIGKIRPRALALLVSVLDERRYIDSTLLGERVEALPSFRFVAATNTGEVSDLPEFIQSRMRPVITVGHATKEEIKQIVFAQRGVVQENRDALLEEFWTLFKKRAEPPTPRDAIQLLALASSLRDYYSVSSKDWITSRIDDYAAVRNMVTGKAGFQPIETRHLGEAYDELFGRGSA